MHIKTEQYLPRDIAVCCEIPSEIYQPGLYIRREQEDNIKELILGGEIRIKKRHTCKNLLTLKYSAVA